MNHKWGVKMNENKIRSKFHVPAWMGIMHFFIRNPDLKIYSSQLAKKLDVTYSHVVKILALLDYEGLLIKEKAGRTIYLRLSAKGKKIAEPLADSLDLVGNTKSGITKK